jgi:Na+/pantothenate symporter
MYIFALGHWNIGKPGVVLTSVLLFFVMFMFEVLIRVSPLKFSAAYFSFLSVFLEGPYYGWQPFSKSLQFSLIVMGLTYLLFYLFGKAVKILQQEKIIP